MYSAQSNFCRKAKFRTNVDEDFVLTVIEWVMKNYGKMMFASDFKDIIHGM